MSHRFYFAENPIDGLVTLTGDQAHHAVNVMRYQLGDSIVLFDGRGTEHHATIDAISRKQVVARITETRIADRQLDRNITIAVALPKGDRQKFMVEKLVELGVHAMIPLSTRRSVAAANTKVIDRINKQVIEASKQCGRNVLMQVHAEMSVDELANLNSTAESERLLADPYTKHSLADHKLSLKEAIVAIGPEGGFEESESKTLTDNGWQPVQFGPSILRIETAAIAAAAILGIGGSSS